MNIAFIVLFIMFLALNYLDAVSTLKVIQLGSFRNERNPIARWVIKKYGAFKGILMIKGVIVILIPFIIYAFIISARDTVYTLVLIDAVYLLVVMNNFKIAKKMRHLYQDNIENRERGQRII
ncbi:MAG TPA: DUF5658 family protein [Candidatus Cloacimonadota bacterium]|nr:DUF5658 family protein [Candidatus Cloacimonadota bacterium]